MRINRWAGAQDIEVALGENAPGHQSILRTPEQWIGYEKFWGNFPPSKIVKTGPPAQDDLQQNLTVVAMPSHSSRDRPARGSQMSDKSTKSFWACPYYLFQRSIRDHNLHSVMKCKASTALHVHEQKSAPKVTWGSYISRFSHTVQQLPGTEQAPNNVFKTSERRYLPLVINGALRHAIPDTGVIENAISEDFALSIGAVIERLPHTPSFINARNRTFEAVGTTRLVLSIPDTSSQSFSERKRNCSFAVVKELAADLVLGSHFLRDAEIFTKFAHLLVKKTMPIFRNHAHGLKKVWRFMHMNLPTQELACFLDDKAVFAALDSGSDIDVVSLEYAKSRKWRVEPVSEGKDYVVLANNEIVKLKGYVETTFEFAGGCPIPKRFYVLDGLVCEVVLGDPTLEALDVFNKAGSSIIEGSTSENLGNFRMIQWIEEIDKLGHDAQRILANLDSPMTSSGRRKAWRSFLSMKFKRKDNSLESSVVVDRLRQILEDVEVRSANWRRSSEEELLELTDDEYSHRKEEFEKRKKQNEEIRDEILSHILRLEEPGPGPAG